MSTGLLFPRGATAVVPLSFGQSLVGATLQAWFQRGPFEASADAWRTYALGTGLAIVSAVAGTAQLTIPAADSSAFNFDPDCPPYWSVVATLANGNILALDALQGPILFSQIFPDLKPYPPCTTILDLGAGGSAPAPIVPALPSVLPLPGLTHLTGGDMAALDGLSADDLAGWSDGQQVILSFANGVQVTYRLSTPGAPPSTASPFTIVPVNDATRAWALLSVSEQGQPCVYNAETTKFYRLWSAGPDGGAAPSIDANGFTIV
jgi:hypothetical protein